MKILILEGIATSGKSTLTETIKKELKEQNKFLHSMLKSIEDIKKGKVKKFKFSKKSDL